MDALNNNELTTEKIQALITSILSRNNNLNLFEQLFHEFENHHQRQVSNIHDLRNRDSKKSKGDVWERFCCLYLSNLTSDAKGSSEKKYKNIWLWKDVPSDVLRYLNLRETKVDNGIDIIAELNIRCHKTEYDAIQCKYLKDTKKYVSWTTLSTFVGLCARSGPWNKQVVMTTGTGVTRKVPRTNKDQSMCIGTFKGISREMFMKMSGNYVEHRLSDLPVISIPNLVSVETVNIPSGIEIKIPDLSSLLNSSSSNINGNRNDVKKTVEEKRLDDLREKRLRYFNQ